MEIKFSGVVITFNEAQHLRQCLQGLTFCEELVVVDLGSNDDSLTIADQMGARVVHHERVPVIEKVRAFAVAQAGYDWVVFVDPDFVLPTRIIDRARDAILKDDTVREKYRQLGLENAKRLSWSRKIRSYLQVYYEAIG